MNIPYTVEPREDTGLYNAKLGVWLFLASEVMLFGALFSSYILLRFGADPGTWPRHWLDYKLGAVNTIILIISSVTNVVAWANLKPRSPWSISLMNCLSQQVALPLEQTGINSRTVDDDDARSHHAQ